ncbi:MAG: segregation/condensation protein A [Spirochaetales bacterium]|nr:segregation/condensation protein A [Spirochaetales bacterium]
MVEFKTAKFEGPLDLLLALIQKAEVNIYDIPISEITDQFLDYLHHAKEIGLGDLSEFYKMAAELIWIKSQMMLPVEVEFGEEYVDPREELVERLLEYSKFKKYSELLMGNESSDNLALERKPSEFQLPFSDEELWEDVTTKDLMDTFMEIMKNYSFIEEKVFNVYEDVTEKEKIALMNELFETRDQIQFTDLITKKTPMHVICAFLAVLESVKDKMILVDQPVLFGDMTLTKRPVDWDPNLADDYDAEYDEMKENHLEDEDDFSVITEEESDNAEER